ncbi:hypothetical protein [Nocardioides sp. SYSU D00038]|uniref:hypothetical protein n=1 Tax=Nocardioides sp. SYSU D00038 TaxID=2812554 RepID=UPI00196716C0|nr:hypothetical protein [Nocardioides sp. SYSU D00038]
MPRWLPTRARRPLLALLVPLVLVLVAAVAVVGVRVWQDHSRTELERAVDLAPSGSERFAWTDWAGVRRELDAPEGDLDALLDLGFDADLTSASSMVDSAAFLDDLFGFSPENVEWELLAQGESGAVALLQMPDSVDLEALGDGLEGLGFTRPDEEDGVWVGGEELIADLAPGSGISPQFQNLAIDADEHLVIGSDNADYLATALDGDRGVDGVEQVVGRAGEPLSAVAYADDRACTALSMAQADGDDQAEADELVAAAGEVNPLTGFLLGSLPDGTARVVMSFEDDDQARRNADARSTLASGPAPGQGGGFADRFELGRVEADGEVVTMELEPVEGSFIVSDLGSGPVLFATC